MNKGKNKARASSLYSLKSNIAIIMKITTQSKFIAN